MSSGIIHMRLANWEVADQVYISNFQPIGSWSNKATLVKTMPKSQKIQCQKSVRMFLADLQTDAVLL